MSQDTKDDTKSVVSKEDIEAVTNKLAQSPWDADPELLASPEMLAGELQILLTNSSIPAKRAALTKFFDFWQRAVAELPETEQQNADKKSISDAEFKQQFDDFKEAVGIAAACGKTKDERQKWLKYEFIPTLLAQMPSIADQGHTVRLLLCTVRSSLLVRAFNRFGKWIDDAPWGATHAALQIGPIILDWEADALVKIRPWYNWPWKKYVISALHLRGNVKLESHHYATLSKKIADYNTKCAYSATESRTQRLKANCQAFVLDAMECIGIQPWWANTDNVVRAYVTAVNKDTDRHFMCWYPSDDGRFSADPNIPLKFVKHEQLDARVKALLAAGTITEGSFDWILLKSWDRAFWLRDDVKCAHRCEFHQLDGNLTTLKEAERDMHVESKVKVEDKEQTEYDAKREAAEKVLKAGQGTHSPVPSDAPRDFKKRGLRILSIDGGGTRGLVALQAIKRIEKETGRKIRDLFDVICGTSTGGLLSVGIGLCGMTPDEIEKHYKELSIKVFGKNKARQLSQVSQDGARYDADLFEKFLRVMFDGKAQMQGKSSYPKVFAVTHLEQSPLPYLLRSYDMPGGSALPGESKLPIIQALRSTSAAPSYFRGVRHEGKDFVDGGLGYNNPTMVALTEARFMTTKLEAKDDPQRVDLVVSLGTGQEPLLSDRMKEYSRLHAGGLSAGVSLLSLNPLTPVLAGVGSSIAPAIHPLGQAVLDSLQLASAHANVDRDVKTLLSYAPKAFNYFRVDPPDLGKFDLAEYRAGNLEKMIEETNGHLDGAGKAELDNLLACLKE